ncbi:MAG: hypothetical protein IJY46_05710 [Lentisphaeria bacterium]|nr:hypothetical protein [Lentisphaeria bacterium]
MKFMEYCRFIFEMVCGGGIFVFLAAAHFSASEKNIAKLEKLTRNRIIGLLIALPALAACVPHAQIVAPGILQNPVVLWALAITIPVLSYFYIDFFTARAISGAVIILSYDIIHYAYDCQLPGAAVITIVAWISGFGGIWGSGKPCALRDSFRLAARKPLYANLMGWAALVVAAIYLFTIITGIICSR